MLACAVAALTITSSVVLSAVVLTKQSIENELKPTGRENYEHVSINYLLDKKEIYTKCLSFVDDAHQYIIDNKKFKKNINTILRNALKKINRFATNINNHTIEVNYKLQNDKDVLVDIVWYIHSNNPHKYYDQFSISLT
jgi:hypothetical protein